MKAFFTRLAGPALFMMIALSLLLAACGDATSTSVAAISNTPAPAGASGAVGVGKDGQPLTISAAANPPAVNGTPVKTASGLQYIELRLGTGDPAKVNRTVKVNYTGWLAADGKKFDSSLDRGKTIDFVLGTGSVIPGWDEGLQGMKVGGLRRLLIPSGLAYGPSGRAPVIPPNAALIFDVELEGANQ